jgi:hypothetical protein
MNKEHRGLVAGAVGLALFVLSAGDARAAAPPTVAFHGGPVIPVPRIFLLFAGQWTNQETTDAVNYMQQVTRLLSNGWSGTGLEPTVRQYGVWGAAFWGYATFPAWSPTDAEMDSNNRQPIRDKINQIRAENPGALPPPDPTLLVLVVGKSLSYCDRAYHDLIGPDNYFGVTSYVVGGCGLGYDGQAWWETIAAHEFVEFATDPTLGGAWYFDPYGSTEIADCSGGTCSDDPACSACPGPCNEHIIGFAGRPESLVPHFIDNIRKTCSAFTTSEHAGIAAGRWNPGLTAAFRGTDNGPYVLDAPWGGIPTSLGGATLEAPAVISAATSQDVFVTGTDSVIYQYHRTTSSPWTAATPLSPANCCIVGPPSAAYHNSHKIVVGLGFDSHPWVFDDSGIGSWSVTALPVPSGNVLAMTPPRVFTHSSSSTVDIMFTGNNGHLYWTAWGNQASCPPFVDLGPTVLGLAAESTSSADPTTVDVFAPGAAGSVLRSRIVNGVPGSFSVMGGPPQFSIVGSPIAVFWDKWTTFPGFPPLRTTGTNVFARASEAPGTPGGILHLAKCSGSSCNAFAPVSPQISVTSSPVVIPSFGGPGQFPGQMNTTDIFVRRASDGHLVHQSFNGSTAGVQDDLFVTVR